MAQTPRHYNSLAFLLLAPLTWFVAWSVRSAAQAGMSAPDLIGRLVALAFCTLLFLGGAWPFQPQISRR